MGSGGCREGSEWEAVLFWLQRRYVSPMLRPDQYEALGSLFLGRPVDAQEAPLLYDSTDLTTHAAILGMTGSGKTGLGIALLEECAIDGIPALIIDPKGDLGNLALTFPRLATEDFAPWAEDAAGTAKRWREGLAGWGQGSERIARLQAAAEVAVYTPGSDAGRPLALLGSFAPPAATIDGEARQARLAALVGGVLGMIGLEADPMASREHILLSAIIDRAWTAGETLDLAALIGRVQDPGIKRLGAMDLETMYPAKERFALALRLNQLLASSGAAAWTTGAALDVGSLLYTPEGRPRLAVISIAHLPERERMLVTTLLLAEVLVWMRAQSGTSALRAVLYIDEVAGYVPPVANPPSKAALMTLLKQARAFGLGVVLASQNPADLDYKALANIGTWWIGRLQTERDRQKVLQAFTGDPQEARIAALLPSLGNRRFLQRNVHEDAAVVFESRWTMSYLRGPLTREDLKRLPGQVAKAEGVKRATSPSPSPSAVGTRPVLPADVAQWFLPLAGTATYVPHALGIVRIAFTDAKIGIDITRDVALLAPLSSGAVAVDWATAEESPIAVKDLQAQPLAGASFAELPCAVTAKTITAWQKGVVEAAVRTIRLTLWRSPATGAVSRPGEDERAFRIRLANDGRVARDVAVAALRKRYEPKLATLTERLRKAQATEDKERQQASSATMDSVLSIGTSLLGAFFGRKLASAANAGRVASSGRALNRTMQQRGDVDRAADTVAVIKSQLRELDAEFSAALADLEQRQDPRQEQFEPLQVAAKKGAVSVQVVALGWVAG